MLDPMATKKKAKTRMGRPPVPDDRRLVVRLTLPLTEAMWAEIQSEAEQLQISPAEFIRRTMREKLDS